MGERSVEEGVDLLQEGEGGLGSALGHLHALQPYLCQLRSTWWSCSLLACI